jgi:hypothetical protein
MTTDTDPQLAPAIEAAVDDDDLLAQVLQVLQTLMDQAEINEREIDELKRKIEEPKPRQTEGPRKSLPDSHPWTRDQRTETEWHELVAWVDEICAAHDVADLPVCWPAHEHLVNQWEAARSAWYTAAVVHPGAAMWTWYQYTWHPLRRQMTEHTSCRNGHIDDPDAPATDQAFIPTQASRGYWADDVDADGVVADLVEMADDAAASIPDDEYLQAHAAE